MVLVSGPTRKPNSATFSLMESDGIRAWALTAKIKELKRIQRIVLKLRMIVFLNLAKVTPFIRTG